MLTTVGNVLPVVIGASLSNDVSLRDALLVSVPVLVVVLATGHCVPRTLCVLYLEIRWATYCDRSHGVPQIALGICSSGF